MPLADFAAFKAALTRSPVIPWQKPPSTVLAGRPYDTWRTSPPIGSLPTAAVAPDRTTPGAIPIENGGTGALSLLGARFKAGFASGVYLICDRLGMSGGLSGTVTTAQSTNLPTAALTRYTSGEGVMAGLVIANAVGTTATTVSVSYTNTAPTAGRTSPLVRIGGTGFREANRIILLPNESGDTGVRAVASVTVTATTGTAGNFGVLLFKPLYAVLVDNNAGVTVADYITGNTSGGIPEIVDDACLFVISFMTSTNNGGVGSLVVAEV